MTCTILTADAVPPGGVYSSLSSSVISNDVGRVKTHPLRSGRRSRLSQAREPAEAAVARWRDVRRSMSTLSAQSVSLHHRRCCPPNISSVTRDHDDSCELPPREGGG